MTKRMFQWMVVPAVALTMSVAFVACGDDDDAGTPKQENPSEDPEKPTPVTPDKQLTNEEQKERLSAIGKQVINLVPSTDFEDVAKLGRFIADSYCQNEAGGLGKWMRECVDAVSGEFVKSESNGWGDVYRYTRRIYAVSQFRAHVEWKNGEWNVTERNTSDLQITCPDQNGQKVTVTLNSSSKTKRVFAGEYYRGWDKEYRDGSTYYIDNIDFTYLEVPEQIDVTLTQGSKSLLTATVKTDLSSMSGTDFNLSRDRYGVEVNATCCGYTFKNIRANAKANTRDGATVSLCIEKDGKALITANVKGEVDVKGGYLSEDDQTKVEVNGGNVTALELDILGQLQVKGACTNIKACYDALRNAKDSQSMAEAMGYIDEANKMLNAAIYYDKTSTQQATLKMDVFEDQEYYGTDYELRPLICFPDGSSYCITDESYFNKTNFQALINLFENLMDDYERLVHRYLK